MLGMSYPGWLTVMAMLDPHPALKAVSPQASPADMFIGDDFHHNGAFRLSYGFEYATMMETGKEITPFEFDSPTCTTGISSSARSRTSTSSPARQDPDVERLRDASRLRRVLAGGRRSAPKLDRVTVPTLNVAGWWDQEDFYGPIKIYEMLERARHAASELSRRRPVESRRLERRQRRAPRPDPLRLSPRRTTSAEESKRHGSRIGSRARAH